MAKKPLAKLLRAQVKKDMSEDELDFFTARYDPEQLYRRYLDRNARNTVNVSYAIFDDADALKGKWSDPGWSDVIRDARSEVHETLKFGSLARMYMSEEFKAYHASQGGTERVEGQPFEDDEPDREPPLIMQAAGRLGVKDAEGLRLYAAALEKHGAEKVKAAEQKLIKKERLGIKITTLNAFLYRVGAAKESKVPQPETLGQTGPQIRLNRKALGLCGFENMRTDKAFSRIRTFILAMEKKDKRAAEVVFAKIMKEEPPTSMLNGSKLIDLFKAMKKRKAFEVVS